MNPTNKKTQMIFGLQIRVFFCMVCGKQDVTADLGKPILCTNCGNYMIREFEKPITFHKGLLYGAHV